MTRQQKDVCQGAQGTTSIIPVLSSMSDSSWSSSVGYQRWLWGSLRGKEWDSSHSHCWLRGVNSDIEPLRIPFSSVPQKGLTKKKYISYSFNELVFAQYTQLRCVLVCLADGTNCRYITSRLSETEGELPCPQSSQTSLQVLCWQQALLLPREASSALDSENVSRQ